MIKCVIAAVINISRQSALYCMYTTAYYYTVQLCTVTAIILVIVIRFPKMHYDTNVIPKVQSCDIEGSEKTELEIHCFQRGLRKIITILGNMLVHCIVQ